MINGLGHTVCKNSKARNMFFASPFTVFTIQKQCWPKFQASGNTTDCSDMPQYGTYAHHTEDGRRAERLDVNMKATLREGGSTKYVVDLLDLSVTGFRFKTSYNLNIGMRVWLNLPKLEGRQATVMWCEGFVYGCAYDQPLHMAVFDHIVRTYSQKA
jgi:hypothetical protein